MGKVILGREICDMHGLGTELYTQPVTPGVPRQWVLNWTDIICTLYLPSIVSSVFRERLCYLDASDPQYTAH